MWSNHSAFFQILAYGYETYLVVYERNTEGPDKRPLLPRDTKYSAPFMSSIFRARWTFVEKTNPSNTSYTEDNSND